MTLSSPLLPKGPGLQPAQCPGRDCVELRSGGFAFPASAHASFLCWSYAEKLRFMYCMGKKQNKTKTHKTYTEKKKKKKKLMFQNK